MTAVPGIEQEPVPTPDGDPERHGLLPPVLLLSASDTDRLAARSGGRWRLANPAVLTVPGMTKPPSRYEVTVRVAKDDGHPPTRRLSRPQPAGQDPA
jgi:hypothetical protein